MGNSRNLGPALGHHFVRHHDNKKDPKRDPSLENYPYISAGDESEAKGPESALKGPCAQKYILWPSRCLDTLGQSVYILRRRTLRDAYIHACTAASD